MLAPVTGHQGRVLHNALRRHRECAEQYGPSSIRHSVTRLDSSVAELRDVVNGVNSPKPSKRAPVPDPPRTLAHRCLDSDLVPAVAFVDALVGAVLVGFLVISWGVESGSWRAGAVATLVGAIAVFIAMRVIDHAAVRRARRCEAEHTALTAFLEQQSPKPAPPSVELERAASEAPHRARAYELPHLAYGILAEIEDSTAWGSPLLAVDRIRLNIDEERRQIVESCNALLQLYMLTDAVLNPGGDPFLSAERERRVALGEAAERAIIERVAALRAYRTGLREVETLMKRIAAITYAQNTADEVDRVMSTIVVNELACAEITAMTVDLDGLRANLEAQLAFLRRDVIEAPSLSTPLSLAS